MAVPTTVAQAGEPEAAPLALLCPLPFPPADLDETSARKHAALFRTIALPAGTRIARRNTNPNLADDMVVGGRARKRYTRQRMNQHKINNSEVRAEQVASKPQTLKLGLDVHAETIVVVRILDQSGPQPAQKFTPAKFLEWVKKQVALGIHNVVVQPVCLDERRTGVNDDKRDARELALRLDRYVAGNRHALATVRVPTLAEEQQRIQSRQREQLRREVQRVASQGRSLLLTQSCRTKNNWWQPTPWIRLRGQLPGWLRERLEVFRTVLATLRETLAAVTTHLEAAAPAVRPKGLGGLTHTVIEREVGDWRRFTNRRQVGSYTGLCGGISASGKSCHLLPITKHGNVRLRTALIELAWRLVVWQPDGKLVKKWQPMLSRPAASKGARKKAIVAIARQVAVDLWRWKTGRAKPADFGWTMVGA
jgi:transposase